jgi:hypothetical protein
MGCGAGGRRATINEMTAADTGLVARLAVGAIVRHPKRGTVCGGQEPAGNPDG